MRASCGRIGSPTGAGRGLENIKGSWSQALKVLGRDTTARRAFEHRPNSRPPNPRRSARRWLFFTCRLLAQVSAEYDRNENKDFVSEVSLAGDSGKVKYELTSKLRGKTDFTLATTTSDGTTIEAEGAVEVCPQPHPSPAGTPSHAVPPPTSPQSIRQ